MSNDLKEHGLIANLASHYSRNPLLRALVELVPVAGGAVDTAITTQYQRIHEERTRAFFDELAAGRIEVSPELLASEDFLHAFFASYRAATRARQREKTRLFARLLRSVGDGHVLRDIDDFDDYLSILEELSFREWSLLAKVERLEEMTAQSQPDRNPAQRCASFWESLKGEAERDLGIPGDELDFLMARLPRTGCYETFAGQFYDATTGQGRLTPVYFRLKQMVDARGERDSE